MSLSERSRSSLYLGLRTVIDNEEAVDEMLSHFPARDLDEPVTKDHLRAEMADLDTKMTERLAAIEQRMTIGFAAADKRMTDGFAAADKRMTDGFAAADKRAAEDVAATDRKLAALQQGMSDRHAALDAKLSGDLRKWFLATVGAISGLNGLATGLILSQLGS